MNRYRRLARKLVVNAAMFKDFLAAEALPLSPLKRALAAVPGDVNAQTASFGSHIRPIDRNWLRALNGAVTES